MSPYVPLLLTWAARLAGVAVSLFLAVFALDAFDGRPLMQVLPDLLLHLGPALLVAAVVATAWRHPWVGAFAFALLAVAYAASVPQRPDWVIAISGPLAITAALFVGSALAARRRRRHLASSS